MINDRYAACIRCAYVMPWIQHERLRFAMPCHDCGTEEQFGPGVYVPEFCGYKLNEVLRQKASKQGVTR